MTKSAGNLRFGVEEVKVRGSARLKEEDDPFRFGGIFRGVRKLAGGVSVLRKDSTECSGADSVRHFGQEIPSCARAMVIRAIVHGGS